MSAAPVVMVVDDDPDIRGTLEELLREEGYAVVTAANGREALDLLLDGAAHPCVILLDLMMPVMDGWQFRTAQLESPALAHLPVVAITAAGPKLAASIPVEMVLPKPLCIEAVLGAIERFCGSA